MKAITLLPCDKRKITFVKGTIQPNGGDGIQVGFHAPWNIFKLGCAVLA